jgi:hypothetical protein
MTENMKNREVIFEYRQMGNLMRVTAVDVATMTEVVVQCPVTAGEGVFQKQGLARLEYVLRKNGIVT